jgi:hypothetical protein
MFGFFRRFYRWIATHFRAEQGTPPPAAPALPLETRMEAQQHVDAAKVYAAGLVPPPEQPAQEQLAPALPRRERRKKDSERRKFEKARMKFDKFVSPKGELPQPQPRLHEPRSELATVRREDVTIADDGNEIIIGGHHFDHKTNVAYYADELYGEFNFRDTILDQLERYFVYLDRMQKRDPDAYGFYKNVGATLLPYLACPDVWLKEWHPKDKQGKTEKDIDKLSPWFLKTRPAFGCIAYGAHPEAEKKEREKVRNQGGKEYHPWIPRFMYFIKYIEPPFDLQPMSGGDVYSMTVFWDKTDEDKMLKGGGSPESYGVFISNKGEMCCLKQLDTKWQTIRAKQRHGHHRGKTFTIPQRAWAIPHELEGWARQHGSTASVFLCNLFAILTYEIERAAWSMIKVSIEKDGRHAMFGVDILRMAYFFQDRDIELTKGGRRKPIFHMVRPHLHSDGHARKLRFQGERDFTWAGYNVKIRVPGRDHAMNEEMDVGMRDSFWQEKGEKYVGAPEIGRMFREYIDTGQIDKDNIKEETTE